MTHEQQAELFNLYHLAKTALDNPTPYERMSWAARTFTKKHHEIPASRAFKILSDAIEGNNL